MKLLTKDEYKGEMICAKKAGCKIEMECLQVLLAEIDSIENRENKKLSPEEIVKIIRKQCSSIEEIIKYKKEEPIVERQQLQWFNRYLPQLLNEVETERIVRNLVEENSVTEKKQFGIVMKNLPKNVDKKIASKILNNILQ